uniref:Uncharacterized protein n=1 Tax=Meloidogyne floridensis TaxID=298350 RepID=A0A915PAF3_9BILA
MANKGSSSGGSSTPRPGNNGGGGGSGPTKTCQFKESFAKAKNWVRELQRQASPNIVIALSGNKADLAAKRVVEYEEAQAYAEDNGLLFLETSAKSLIGSIFAKRLPKNEGAGGGGPAGRGREGVNIGEGEGQNQARRSCCGGGSGN